MGQRNGRHQPEIDELYCAIHMEMIPVGNSKVLGCGHCFCQACLKEWKKHNFNECPNCRKEELRAVSDLPGFFQQKGELYPDQSPRHEQIIDIEEMIHAQIVRRAKTTRILRETAKAVTEVELVTSGVKIGGSAAGLVATGLVITGSALSLTGVGAVAGITLVATGGIVGFLGGFTVGGGIIGEGVAKNKELNCANSSLQSDFFHSMQLRILFSRAAQCDVFAQRFNIKSNDAASFVGVVGRSAKVVLASVNLAKASALGVARGVGTAGLHVAGIVISAVLIPVDLFQMIKSSIRIHKKEKAEIAVELEKTAADLETQLMPVLKEREYKIVEIERFDNEKKKHALLVAIEKSKFEDVVNDSNISTETIKVNHVVLIDTLGDAVEPELYEQILNKWNSTSDEEEEEEEETRQQMLQYIDLSEFANDGNAF